MSKRYAVMLRAAKNSLVEVSTYASKEAAERRAEALNSSSIIAAGDTVTIMVWDSKRDWHDSSAWEVYSELA